MLLFLVCIILKSHYNDIIQLRKLYNCIKIG